MDLTRWLWALLGGALIGLASAGVLLTQGRVAGVGGICGGLLRRPAPGESLWRLGFVAGLVAFGLTGSRLLPESFSLAGAPDAPWIIVAGLLVGFGTCLGNGCTSGHGVCGIARLSRRSMVATLTFMATAALTVLLTRHALSGGG
jgi:hypothetical protein